MRGRLETATAELTNRVATLNADRLEHFGSSRFEPVGSSRIRTENNCIPRDIAGVGPYLLFGYNVYIGLRSETSVSDVFSIHRFERDLPDGPEGDPVVRFEPVDPETVPGLLEDAAFQNHFRELYTYYRNTRLVGLHRPDERLLAVFQTGDTLDDLRVFRWSVAVDGTTTYIDDRGEREHSFPPTHDMEWVETTRADHVTGRFPHINVADELFVHTDGGELTIRVENNTERGEVVWRESVAEGTQSLADASVHYARAGHLLLLRVLPYKEHTWRYFVYTPRIRQVERLDAVGLACQQLPEDHGIIFPGGYHLENGDTRTFDVDLEGMVFKEVVRSPNGEDVLYVFHDQASGRSILSSYNVIRRQVSTPIACHGYSRFDDGTIVVFQGEGEEPTRLHRMQVWDTPYTSEDYATGQPTSGTFLDTIGNAEVVRAISDLYALAGLVTGESASSATYERLIAEASRIIDAYFWLGAPEVHRLADAVASVRSVGELVLGEFDRTEQLRTQAERAVNEAAESLHAVVTELELSPPDSVDGHVEGLVDLRRQQGHLLSLRDLRYVDTDRLDELDERVVAAFDAQVATTVGFLSEGDAFGAYHQRLEELEQAVAEAGTVADADELTEQLDRVATGLELLTEVVAGLTVSDATVRTVILEEVSKVLGGVNRVRALLDGRRADLRRHENVAAFGAEFLVLGQSVQSSLSMADTPEACDDQLARMLAQVEGLETRFGDTEEFAEQLATRREEIYEAFTSRKQTLTDERQRRVERMVTAARRVLDTVARRAATFSELDELNAFFAGDPTVARVRDLVRDLRQLGESVRADELTGRLATLREEAGRFQRDRADLYEDGDNVIRLGTRRFSVNSQPLDVTLVPGEDTMDVLLSGTDYRHPVDDPDFVETRPWWSQVLVSENDDLSRAEFLATSLLAAAESGDEGLSTALLADADLDLAELGNLVRHHAEERYDEGYERGVHDHDAAAILDALVRLRATAGLLRFAGPARAVARWWWTSLSRSEAERWLRRCRSAMAVRHAVGGADATGDVATDLSAVVAEFVDAHGLPPVDTHTAGAYLVEELAGPDGGGGEQMVCSASAAELRDRLTTDNDPARDLPGGVGADSLVDELAELGVRDRHRLASAWVQGWLRRADETTRDRLAPAAEEAAGLLATADGRTRPEVSHATEAITVSGLLSRHRRIQGGSLEVRLDDLVARADRFRREVVPGFRAYQARRHELLERERRMLRLEELIPQPMAGFVRNHLIDQVYLPLIGDNLARQLGTVGEGGADRSGLLMVVSPPGYGKTTLMEYVAGRLGLVMVKVNGPALGTGVTSVDPDEAPNATARQEVERINLALEMGNNVMLYLDDIQHCNPELLQRFIPLCDAQRRMEGVWQGQTRTYDLRGKRFCVVMAGNPYTESGDRFRIPDMLANRADTHNLGEVLGSHRELFELSYLENALTSNAVTAPLAGRAAGDILLLVRMARGEQVPPDQLSHPYGRAELEELLAVLGHLVRVQGVVSTVNSAYIASAAQRDADRTEPPFYLQGSYRNMNRMAQRVVAAMNDDEVERLIDDHYQGEAQTLTSGTEENLLKLAALRGTLEGDRLARWDEICSGYRRRQSLGGEDDPMDRIVLQLARLAEGFERR
ncbi:MAG: DNA repair ATPase [Acidimicrobiia bacterium]|nr:DNA repair ATPase [Acidimicrobiia bacterium]